MIHPFTYKKADTLREARELATSPTGRVLAGGTDLVPNLKDESLHAELLVRIAPLPELSGIRTLDDGTIRLGAMVTLSEMDQSALLNEQVPELAYAAARVASPQIRNLATLGGNLMQDRRCIYFNQSHDWRSSIERCYKTGGAICHQGPRSPVCRASYYSDVATALCVLDAKVNVWLDDREQTLPIAAFCERHGKLNGTSVPERILIESIDIPPREGKGYFIKEGVRHSIDFPLFNAAGSIFRKENGRIGIRLAAGAVTAHPILLSDTAARMEALINGDETEESDTPVTIAELAMKEVNRAAVFIVEDNITPKVKRTLFQSLGVLTDRLLAEAKAFV